MPPELVFPLAAPSLVGAVAAAVLLAVVLLALPEPPHARRSLGGVLREVPATVVSGVRLAAGGRVLRRLMLASAASGVMLMSIELLTPGRLAQLAGTAEQGSTAYAVVAALGFAGSAAGSALAPRAARLAGGSARGAIAGLVATALSVGALAATAGLGGAAGLLTARRGLRRAVRRLLGDRAAVPGDDPQRRHGRRTHHRHLHVLALPAVRRHPGQPDARHARRACRRGRRLGVSAAVVLASALLFVRMPVTGSSRAPVPAARAGSG
ncbi:hypothetical protein ACFSTC_06430 [Nonomuraea ferruginea]